MVNYSGSTENQYIRYSHIYFCCGDSKATQLRLKLILNGYKMDLNGLVTTDFSCCTIVFWPVLLPGLVGDILDGKMWPGAINHHV